MDLARLESQQTAESFRNLLAETFYSCLIEPFGQGATKPELLVAKTDIQKTCAEALSGVYKGMGDVYLLLHLMAAAENGLPEKLEKIQTNVAKGGQFAAVKPKEVVSRVVKALKAYQEQKAMAASS